MPSIFICEMWPSIPIVSVIYNTSPPTSSTSIKFTTNNIFIDIYFAHSRHHQEDVYCWYKSVSFWCLDCAKYISIKIFFVVFNCETSTKYIPTKSLYSYKFRDSLSVYLWNITKHSRCVNYNVWPPTIVYLH